MRWAVVAVVAAGACADRAPSRCVDVQVPQDSLVSRVPTCREVEMHVALGLCAEEPPIIPKDASRNGPLATAWDMSVDDCLREWVKVFDACEDEPDRQFRCERSP